MIFITLGSQKFQFNRVLSGMDQLLETGALTEQIYAQTGYSDYLPKYYAYQPFITREEFSQKITDAEIILTHGGSGAIISSLKENKIVIAVPRLEQYQEHVDDHQLEIIDFFVKAGYLYRLDIIEDLPDLLTKINNRPLKKFESNNHHFVMKLMELM